MVHWSFILGQGWLLSNQFCTACQNCLHPSVVTLHNAVRMHNCCSVVKDPTNASMQHKQRQIEQTDFDLFYKNLLMCSHP